MQSSKMENENDEKFIESTKELSKEIKPIEKDTVNKICSGQVVVRLSIAVKELVENSLDASATLVEIKLKNYGLDNIEVIDNGYGVEESNLEALTAKYHTSKIREFSDLSDVETFGFRGEALSSLCALADMAITTKHESSKIGTRIELDHYGKIIKKSACARQNGTTVTLSNLFSTIPVRRKELTKNIKKQFSEMCQILQAYCLVSKNTKIVCTNQNEKGVRTTLMSTQGSSSILDNIVCVFNSKQKSELIEIQPPNKNEEIFSKENLVELKDLGNSSLMEISDKDINELNSTKFKFEGWISSCSHGSGRSSKDRQYFYINSRPCEPKNVSKLINDIYHRYNVQQYPFIFLNININRPDVDVNVQPDKRQLLVNNEKILLIALKKSLLNTFENIPSTFKIQNSTLYDSFLKIETPTTQKIEDEEITETDLLPSSQKYMQSLSQWKATGSTIGAERVKISVCDKRRLNDDDEIKKRGQKIRKIQEYLTQSSAIDDNNIENLKNYSYKSDSEEEENNLSIADESKSDISFSTTKFQKQLQEFDLLLGKKTNDDKSSVCSIETDERHSEEVELKSVYDTPPRTKSITKFPEIKLIKQISCKNISNSQENSSNSKLISEEFTPPSSQEQIEQTENLSIPKFQALDDEFSFLSQPIIELDEEDSETFVVQPKTKISITLSEIKNLMIQENKFIKLKKRKKVNLERLKFKSDIDPNKNQKAEEELEREIKKQSFKEMQIIGQFNLGFIITRLDEDLFIIDQHASDEKYNYEKLQQTVNIQHQKLAHSEKLDLTAIDEMILIDKLHIFEANGFKFEIDENAPSTKKVKLLGKPYSKNWEFGKNDIADLIFMLQDAPNDTMCRPTKIQQMFASRACRQSVMIGTALTKNLMKKLVDHMSEIDHPWNCPHGRPTMRHLINLSMLECEDSET